MPPKKEKAQKMTLNDFLTDPGTGSWADEMSDMPSAPAGYDPSARPGSFASRGYGDRDGGRDRDGGGRSFGRDRDPMTSPNRERYASPGHSERYPPRDRPVLELPTVPPFTAHVANLPFDTNDADLTSFFDGLKISKIRIVKDHDDKPKGFGYVEFEDQESLKNALTLTGEQFSSRPIRINIAEPPKEREPRSPTEDRTEVSSWRRATPLEPSRPSRGSSGFGDRDRGDHAGFGGDRGDRGDRGGFRDRSAGSGFGRDRDGGDRDRGSGRDRESRTDTEWRGGAFVASRRESGGSAGGFDRKEGGGFGRDRGGFGGNGAGADSAPTSRPRLQLQARSTGPLAATSIAAPPPATESYQTSKKPNPFGDAKPIDSDEAIRRVEEKRKQRDAELQKKQDEKKTAEEEKNEENGAAKEVE